MILFSQHIYMQKESICKYGYIESFISK
ncbi:uncharacterized protein METZ01_LOCUS35217 [marine metagenome]|uniref:Uncharacterized protein n=1 Tax=marine metagenome TaxID=408172 RepID=A0A381QXU9_9ZZZZ